MNLRRKICISMIGKVAVIPLLYLHTIYRAKVFRAFYDLVYWPEGINADTIIVGLILLCSVVSCITDCKWYGV